MLNADAMVQQTLDSMQDQSHDSEMLEQISDIQPRFTTSHQVTSIQPSVIHQEKQLAHFNSQVIDLSENLQRRSSTSQAQMLMHEPTTYQKSRETANVASYQNLTFRSWSEQQSSNASKAP